MANISDTEVADTVSLLKRIQANLHNDRGVYQFEDEIEDTIFSLEGYLNEEE